MKYNLNKMMGLDMYLSSLSKSEYISVSKKIRNDSRIITPLTSWDIYSEGYKTKLREAERSQDVKRVKAYADTLNWENNIESLFEDETFEALILTDINQNIIWVNKGFTKMTGYAKREVISKKPNILQGQETSVDSKKNIKQQLEKGKPFTEVITNYKKDGKPYRCEVKIFSLKTGKHKTHYLALERQVN